MVLAVTSLDRSQNAPGSSATTTQATASVSPTGGALLAAILIGNYQNASGVNDVGTLSLADTFTGTGAWTRQASCIRTGVASLAYCEHVEIWTALAGSTPGSGVATMTRAPTGTADEWLWIELLQITGQSASPIGATTGAIGRTAAGPTTYVTTLGGAPAATSLVIGGIQADNTALNAGVVPTGWTTSRDDIAPSAWGASNLSGYINGGASTASTWTGCRAGANYLGASIEIVAAAGGGAQPTPWIRRNRSGLYTRR